MPYYHTLNDLFGEAHAEAIRRDQRFRLMVQRRQMNARQAEARIRAMEAVAGALAEMVTAGCVRPVCPHCLFGVYRPPQPTYFCPSCGCEFGGDEAAGTALAT